MNITKGSSPVRLFDGDKVVTGSDEEKQQEPEYTQGLVVSSHGQSGGLALLWETDSKVAVQGFSCWYINAYVICTITGLTWRITGFYGQPDTSRREETWSILESLKQSN